MTRISIKQRVEFYEAEIENKNHSSKKGYLTRIYNYLSKELNYMKETSGIYYQGELKAPQIRDIEDEQIAINKVRKSHNL